MAKNKLQKGQDVRTIRDPFNQLVDRTRRLEADTGPQGRQKSQHGAGKSVVAVAELTGSTTTIDSTTYPTADIYRGERRVKKIATAAPVYIHNTGISSWSNYSGVRVQCVKLHGFWEVASLQEALKLLPGYTPGTDQVAVHRGSDDTVRYIDLNDFTCP